MDEGVIKFKVVQHHHSLYFSLAIQVQFKELDRWKQVLFKEDIIGCDLTRYGACYGNVSMRYIEPDGTFFSATKPEGYRCFLITGTQTGNRERITPGHYVRVYKYDIPGNTVYAEGPLPPSSESMTPGAV